MTVIVDYVHCQNVEEFLKEISPLRVPVECSLQWIYRGVCSFENHKLVPRILRDEKPPWHEIGLHEGGNPVDIARGHPTVEYGVMCRFFRALDENGLPVPGDSPALSLRFYLSGGRSLLDDLDQSTRWPPHWIVELMALAQHYGLSTRLLDWSRSPLHAAYFAVTDAFKPEFNPEGRLAVWCFHHALTRTLLVESPLQIVNVPSYGNPNLQAQKGVFTLWPTPISPYDKDDDRKPLDEKVAAILNVETIDGEPFYPFRCVTLPRAQTPQLADALHQYGIDAGSLFPGLAGAAQCVRERSAVQLLKRST